MSITYTNCAIDLLALAQAAIKFSQAAADVNHRQQVLDEAYFSWRVSAGVKELIKRDDENWVAMMTATAEEYRQKQNAKGRERRAKAKLLALVAGLEANE